jgi:hypothetical protein
VLPAEPAGYRVLIAYISRSEVSTEFAYDLAQMIGHTAGAYLGHGVEAMRVERHTGTYIMLNRFKVVCSAMEKHFTHILWLDSDMRFPKDTLVRLLNHDQFIVGANYPFRRVPVVPTAHNDCDKPVHRPVYTYESSQGLEDVEALGFGCLLTNVQAFEATPAPWFIQSWHEQPAGKTISEQWGMSGEDVNWFRMARKVGLHVMLDHDLSKQVAHIGPAEFTYLDAIGMKDAAREQYPHLYIEPAPEAPKLEIVK